MPQIGDIYNYHLKITLPNQQKPVVEESVYIMVLEGIDRIGNREVMFLEGGEVMYIGMENSEHKTFRKVA